MLFRSGPSTFEAKDLSSTVQDVPPVQPKAPGIAQSPEEIRRKLAERQASQPQSSGRASFTAKDIESDLPPAEKGNEKKPEETDKPKPGRAIFEAKDLSDPKP